MGGFFLLLFGLVMIIEGIVMILAPKKMMSFSKSVINIKDHRILGIVSLIVGILLLFSAGSSDISWLIVIFGLIALAKAVYVFVTPIEIIKSNKWFKLDDKGIRIIGIVTLVLGVVVFVKTI